MMPRRSLSAGAGVLAALFSLVGCDDPVAPPREYDTAPTAKLAVSNAAPKEGECVLYTVSAKDTNDNAGVERFVLEFGDGTSKVWTPGAASFSDTVSHVFNAGGSFISTGTAYDKKSQTGKATATVAVAGNQPPVFDVGSVEGEEGLESAVALKSIVHDPEGGPVALQVTSVSPGLEARIAGDSLRYKMTDPDANGAGSIGLQAVDDHNKSASATIPVNVAARDRIAGRVHDILEGSYIAGVNGSLVMQGPFAGYVKIDGVTLPINSDGTFAFPSKFKSQKHAIEWFFRSLSKTTDSSFVARDSIPAGDYASLDLPGHTNAGTGPTPSDPPLSLGLLKAYYVDMMPMLNSPITWPGGVLCGVNLKQKGNQYTIYLSAKDTNDVMGSGPVLGYTPEMMDTIASRLTERLFIYIPPQNRPRIVKGLPTDALPVTKNQYGTTIPRDGYGIGFRQDSQTGMIYNANPSADGETKYCVVTLSYHYLGGPPSGGFGPATILQEWLTWLSAPGGGTFNQALVRRTCMYEDESAGTPFLSGADQKDLTMFVLYRPGTVVGKLLNLPS